MLGCDFSFLRHLRGMVFPTTTKRNRKSVTTVNNVPCASLPATTTLSLFGITYPKALKHFYGTRHFCRLCIQHERSSTNEPTKELSQHRGWINRPFHHYSRITVDHHHHVAVLASEWHPHTFTAFCSFTHLYKSLLQHHQEEEEEENEAPSFSFQVVVEAI